MPLLAFHTDIAAPLQRVWELHEDVLGALPALSPVENRVTIESADLPVHVGSRIIFATRGPLGRQLRWVALVVEHEPPSEGRARFADEQESGPFAYWRHDHVFVAVGEQSTRLTDRVRYRLPWGPLGVLADLLFVRRKLRRLFAYRHAATRSLLAEECLRDRSHAR